MPVYILYSKSIDQYYAGMAADLEDRLERHNQGRSKLTKRGVPRELVKVVPRSSRSEAAKLEKKIKGRGIRRWLATHN